MKLNKGYFHEAVDRIYCLQSIIEEVIVSHPAFTDKKSRRKLEKVQGILSKLYQKKSQKL